MDAKNIVDAVLIEMPVEYHESAVIKAALYDAVQKTKAAIKEELLLRL